MGSSRENMWGETKKGEALLYPAGGITDLQSHWLRQSGYLLGYRTRRHRKPDQEEVIAKAGPHSGCPHFRPDRPGNVHVLPYTGNTDWDMILKALAKADYKRAFTYEIQHYLLAMPEKLVPDAILLSYKVAKRWQTS